MKRGGGKGVKIFILTLSTTGSVDDQPSMFLGEERVRKPENSGDDGKEIEEQGEKHQEFEGVVEVDEVEGSDEDIQGVEVEKESENARNIEVRQKQAIVREKMKERYNGSHQIHTFKVGDIVTVAIPSKDRAVTDAPRMEAQIVAIPHENRYKLQTEYGVLANHYPTSELNPVPEELLESILQKLSGSRPRTLTMTLHAAAALRSLSTDVTVKCGCKKKCDTKRCNCIKAEVKCTQYCHSGHVQCGNLPDTIAEQTEMSLAPRTKRKRQPATPSSKGSNKKPMVDQTKPPPRARGLQPSVKISLPTRSRVAEARASKDGTRDGEVRDEIGGGEVGGEASGGGGEVGGEVGGGEVGGGEVGGRI